MKIQKRENFDNNTAAIQDHAPLVYDRPEAEQYGQ